MSYNHLEELNPRIVKHRQREVFRSIPGTIDDYGTTVERKFIYLGSDQTSLHIPLQLGYYPVALASRSRP
jgi:hypothetical protein